MDHRRGSPWLLRWLRRCMRAAVHKNVAMTVRLLTVRSFPSAAMKEKLRLRIGSYRHNTLAEGQRERFTGSAEEVRNAMTINLVETIDDVLALALEEQRHRIDG